MGDIYQKESVLTFKSSLIVENGYFQGLSLDIDKYLTAIGKEYFYTEREDAENNYELKQLVMYSIIMHHGLLIRYKRGSHSGDLRLRRKLSVGLGGHISIKDGNVFPDLCTTAMLRELHEEIYINTRYRYKAVAILNDDSNNVGKVHFGIINIVETESAEIFPKEKDIVELKYMSIRELKENVINYESWSIICINNIETILDVYYDKP
ncbi:MAG: hypothetical protein ACLQVJ_29325 [Syntrophobacteraceae bacterium]